MVAEIMTPEKCVISVPRRVRYCTCLTCSAVWAPLGIILKPVGNPSYSQEASPWPLQNDFCVIGTSFYCLMLSKCCKIIETKNLSWLHYCIW